MSVWNGRNDCGSFAAAEHRQGKVLAECFAFLWNAALFRRFGFGFAARCFLSRLYAPMRRFRREQELEKAKGADNRRTPNHF